MNDDYADLADMQKQSDQLLDILRSASADLPEGPARDIADNLITMLTDASAEFFPAAHAMFDDLQHLRASRPTPPAPADPTGVPDDLGQRLREELLRAFPQGTPKPEEVEESSFTEGSLWKGLE